MSSGSMLVVDLVLTERGKVVPVPLPFSFPVSAQGNHVLWPSQVRAEAVQAELKQEQRQPQVQGKF